MEKAIINLLLADADVSALVADRVRPGRRKQGDTLPAAIVHRIGGDRHYDDQGPTGLVDSGIQIDCWADTYGEAKTLANAVAARLNGFEGTVDGVEFQYIYLESERDGDEGGSGQTDYPFRVSLDFNPWHSEGA